jgi:hypothetical protein
LFQTYLLKRGWGASTEHHVLHALNDVIEHEKHALLASTRLRGALMIWVDGGGWVDGEGGEEL